MLKCTSLSRHVCDARSSPYASYLTVYKRGERNECGFETRPRESWMMGSWLRDWQEKERFTRNEEKKIQRYRILVFSSTTFRLNLLRCYFLCYVRSCDSPKGTVSFKTGLILIARVLISKKRQRFNFLKMSCYWRIRRIRPIALKCYIHVIYAVADPAEGTGGPALLIFRPNWGPKGGKKYLRPPHPYLKV